MTTWTFWQVDSFTKEAFRGNPAAVFILREELDDLTMQNIAMEMNLSETAFVLLRKGANPLLRWFMPMGEIDLCGHATLAAAHVLLTERSSSLETVTFDTKSVGALRVDRTSSGYCMDFPSRPGEEVSLENIPAFVMEGLGTSARPVEARKARDLMLVYEDERIIRDIQPDFNALSRYESFIIVTAASLDPSHDFVSRFFCAGDSVQEDPVTGSAHCTLAPYWGAKLGKRKMSAFQASSRGGHLGVELAGDRTLISGSAVTVIEGGMRIQGTSSTPGQ